MNELANEIGWLVICAATLLFWMGGTILLGDYFANNYGRKAGDWVSMIWGSGWPAAFAVVVYQNW